MNWLLRRAMGMMYHEGEAGGTGSAGGPSGASSLSAGGTATVPAGATGPTGAAAPAGGTGATAPAGTWYDGFKDPKVKEWVGSFQGAYPDAESIAAKAWNLEKLLGADKAGRSAIIPKPDAPAEEWKAFYSKIGGVPEKPEAYTLPATTDPAIAEVLKKDPMFAKFQAYAHSLGMPQKFFGDTLQWFMNESKTKVDADGAEFAKSVEADWQALKVAWGKDYDAKHEQAKRAAGTFIPGTPQQREEFLSKIEAAIGTKPMMELFQNIGSKFGEHAFVAGDGKVAGDGSMTPEAARLRIADLEKDKAWSSAYLKGDADKKAEMARLMALAYPGNTAIRGT